MAESGALAKPLAAAAAAGTLTAAALIYLSTPQAVAFPPFRVHCVDAALRHLSGKPSLAIVTLNIIHVDFSSSSRLLTSF